MSSETFKKWPLYIALILPVVLIVAVWLANATSKELSNPPNYNFYYVVNHNYYYKLTQEDNQLYLEYSLAKPGQEKNLPQPELFLYDVQAKQAVNIPYSKPAFKYGTKKWQKVPVLTFDKRMFKPGRIAPDGYQYEVRSNRSFFFDAFGSRTYHHVIYKGRDTLVFTSTLKRVNFLGWQTPQGILHHG